MKEFRTTASKGKYSITFETDNRWTYETVQEFCRNMVDGYLTVGNIPVDWLISTCEEYSKRYGSVYTAVIQNLIDDWCKELEKEYMRAEGTE